MSSASGSEVIAGIDSRFALIKFVNYFGYNSFKNFPT